VPRNIHFVLVCLEGARADTEPNSLRSEVPSIAGFAVYFTFPFTNHTAVDSLIAQQACEAGLVPGLAGAPHQLSDEHGLAAAGADVRPSPLGLHRRFSST